ncbi:MAG: hypothetical protein U0361_16415 [Nitrospiraceae bacterium]
MPVIYIDEAGAHAARKSRSAAGCAVGDKEAAFPHPARRHGRFAGGGQQQAAVGDEQFARSAELTQESSVVLTGTLRQDVRAPGGFELDVRRLDVLQVAQPFPIQPKEHGTAF